MRFWFVPYLALAACTTFPELDAVVSDRAKNAAFPELISLETMNFDAVSTQDVSQVAQNMSTRVTNLRNRSANLKRPVIDRATKQRMLRGVQ